MTTEATIPTRKRRSKVPSGQMPRDVLAKFVAGLNKLNERLDSIESRLNTPRGPVMPTTVGPSATLEGITKGMKAGEERTGIRDIVDVLNPRREGFQSRDIVSLKAGTQKEVAFRNYLDNTLKVGAPETFYGVIIAPLGTQKVSGKRKYKVEFQAGIGRDGVLEDELALAQRAS